MAKQKISVTFTNEAHLGAFETLAKRATAGVDSLRYLNCHDVSLTTHGFLRLVPVLPEDWGQMAFYVHPHTVAWMLEADHPTKLGFV